MRNEEEMLIELETKAIQSLARKKRIFWPLTGFVADYVKKNLFRLYL